MIRRLVFALLLTLPLPAWAVTVEKVTSPGGIEAWLVQDHANPIIAMEVAFAGGAAVETKPGLVNMMASLLDEGAGPYDSQSFQGKLEDLSIGLSFHAGRDDLRGSLKTLTDNRDTAFELFRLALTQPRFDKEPTERIRGQILAGLTRELQNPNSVASRLWNKAAFGAHPYARPVNGAPDTVKAIKTAELKAHAKTWLSRQGLIVGIVGDITPEQLAPLLDQTFGALPASHPAIKVSEATIATGKTIVEQRDIPQSVAVFGAPGIKRDDSNWFPAYVMNYILGGGGFSSRLTEEVREKRGLAYSVYSYLLPMDHAGVLVGGVATQNARVKQSLDLIRQELRRMADAGPSETELADAKTYLTGSFPLSLDSTAAIANLLVVMQSDKLGIDYLQRRNALIAAVDMDQVKTAAKRLLDADNLLVVIVGKPEGVTSSP
ncbi:M16 family metallopeptidase [Magnetospirillum sulfuroxidans]|uniref:Insulinase family protein n=1 Tax=Magnetospirillum sulfuroxidans TaxID=611300 RepID=A0ABS5IBQ6_9PROT|nr:pitrilysin family protein [Magnetospirillum sulfuroxidans]MBR9971859.1 insulinase family protein [Magnetospirillum sulfuroxidans]